jgi:putative copper resistance protein D
VILEAGLIAFRFLHYVAVLSLFGASLFPLYAHRGALRSRTLIEAAQFAWLRRVLLLSVLVAIVSLLGWFAFTAGAMAGSLAGIADPKVLLSVIQATDFGPLWIGRLVVEAIIVMLLLRWPSLTSLWLTPIAAMLLLASLAGTGHARVAEGWAGVLHVTADATHLMAAGVWIGGLLPLSFVILSVNGAADDKGDIAIGEVLIRFSGVGYVAVATLVASGLINTWFLVGSLGALISSTYGWLLLTKISAFLIMAMLAAANRFWVTPNLATRDSASGGWLRRLRRHVVAEQALGLLVLAVVSFLGTMEPPVPV